MAWIRQITEDEATGSIAGVYEAARGRANGVANIIRVMSQDGATAAASMNFYVQLMKRRNALGAPQREMLAAVVSNINECYY